MNYREVYATILLAGLDAQSRVAVQERLARRGYRCLTADSLSELKALNQDTSVDLLLLHSGMPNGQVASFLREVRMESDTPIIVLSDSTCPDSEIHFLEAGADDFVVVRPDCSILVARVRALMRRTRLLQKQSSSNDILGKVVLNDSLQSALYEERSLKLTPIEYQLLRTLGDNLGEAVSRVELLRRVWDTEYLHDNRLIDTHVRNLRKKLVRANCGLAISSVRGVGYKLTDEARRPRT